MNVRELTVGAIYIPKPFCSLYMSPMESYYYLVKDESEESKIPTGISFASLWVDSYKSKNVVYDCDPILYLGQTRENWTIDQYYYRCYKFHWCFVRGRKCILNFHSIQNLQEYISFES